MPKALYQNIAFETDALPKTCQKCGMLKFTYQFQHNVECRGSRTGTCSECIKEYNTQHYRTNKLRKQYLANKKNRERKDKAIDLLGGACHDCSGVFHRCVYDFHHLYDKDMNPSRAINGSWENAQKELKKCILLCANCHRLRHFKEDT